MRDKRHGTPVCVNGEASLGKRFSSSYLLKNKSLPPIVGTLHMILITKSILGLKDPVTLANKKYLSPLRSSSKIIGSVIVENELSRKAWQRKNPGWCQRRQNQGNRRGPQSTWPPSNPKHQKYRFLAEHTGYYSIEYSISGYGFSWFLCAHYNVTPRPHPKNVTAYICPSQYVTDLSAEMEASSLHVTKKWLTSSCTSLNKTSSIPAYIENPSSTGASADYKRRNIRREVAWRQCVTSSPESYEKDILK